MPTVRDARRVAVPNRRQLGASTNASTFRADPGPRKFAHDDRNLTSGKVRRQADGKLELSKDVRRLGRLAVSGNRISTGGGFGLALEVFSLAQICTLNELRQLKQLQFLRKAPKQHYNGFFLKGH